MPAFSPDPRRRAAEEKCLADIEAFGLHVLRIRGDDEYPEYAYSVGLPTLGQPEVLVLGLPADVAQALINRVADLVDEGRRFADGDTVHDIADGFPVVFRAVPAAQAAAHCKWIAWYHEGAPVEVLQLVYPDRAGRWPWEAGIDDAFAWQQPVLATAPVPAWAADPAPPARKARRRSVTPRFTNI